jgi:hypothetical protein
MWMRRLLSLIAERTNGCVRLHRKLTPAARMTSKREGDRKDVQKIYQLHSDFFFGAASIV